MEREIGRRSGRGGGGGFRSRWDNEKRAVRCGWSGEVLMINQFWLVFGWISGRFRGGFRGWVSYCLNVHLRLASGFLSCFTFTYIDLKWLFKSNVLNLTLLFKSIDFITCFT